MKKADVPWVVYANVTEEFEKVKHRADEQAMGGAETGLLPGCNGKIYQTTHHPKFYERYII